MKIKTGIKAPVQAGIEDFKGVFQDQIRTMVRQGILDIIAQEVTDLCGESHLPGNGIYRRAGTEPVTISTSSGKERIAKRRVRMMQEDGTEREIRLNTYAEIRRSKGVFDEILEGMTYGVASSLRSSPPDPCDKGRTLEKMPPPPPNFLPKQRRHRHRYTR